MMSLFAGKLNMSSWTMKEHPHRLWLQQSMVDFPAMLVYWSVNGYTLDLPPSQ